MKIHIHSLCWNEARMLPYYMRHYQPIAEKIFIYDDSSTDDSLDILKGYSNVVIEKFENIGDSFVSNAQTFSNECWKTSRGKADWVIVCNIDEHLYHKDLVAYLQYCSTQGITAIPAQGYQMISEHFPIVDGRLCDSVLQGMPWEEMSKLLIFNPNAIEEINYEVGRHKALPTGAVTYPETTEVKLLHYKYLGLDYLITRHAELRTGLKSVDIEKRWGYQYLWNQDETVEEFNSVKERAVDVMSNNFQMLFRQTECSK